MARSRNIKPGFFLNDELAECNPLTRLLFAGLWCIADREGRLEDRPKRIKAEVLPYDACDVDELLNQLGRYKFILRYEVDGNQYIQIVNFSKHQNPHKNEKESEIPPPDLSGVAPDNSDTSTVQAPEKHNTNRADSLNLIPDSLNNTYVATDVAHCEFIPAEKSSEGDGAQSSTKKKTGKDEYTQGFEEFWKHYPRKIEKRTAFRAYKARLKEGAKPEKLIQASINYSKYCELQKTETRYIKHGSTFLGPDKPFDEFVKRVPEVEEKSRGEPTKNAAPQAMNFQQRQYSKEFYDKIKNVAVKR